MTNSLVLKTIAWNESERGFFSPSHTGFLWGRDVVASMCEKCQIIGRIESDCTCGLYGSPNPETLIEYHSYPNSIVVLMNTYGTIDVWTAPKDIPNCYVTRSWGMKIVRIIGTEIVSHKRLRGQRDISAGLASEMFDSPRISLKGAKYIIRETWTKTDEDREVIIGFDPYQKQGGI